jgi:hypothetical protein
VISVFGQGRALPKNAKHSRHWRPLRTSTPNFGSKCYDGAIALSIEQLLTKYLSQPAMASFPFLDQQEEDKLHKARLLAIEEKAFKRITKRLLTPGSLISAQTQLPPTPPPDDNTEDTGIDQEAIRQKQLEERRQFRDDILLDFAAFDSSIARLQFLHKSNEAERERYRAEKDRIIKKAQEVKDSAVELRVQLEEARRTMEQRKKFDELADRITSNRMLRERGEQQASLLKLEEECRELEKESRAYSETWKERREQFGRIVEEGMQLRRLIRDEKEEVERREGMDGGEEDGEVGETGSRGGATPKHSGESGGATPGHDNAATPKPDGGFTPRPGSPDNAHTSAQNDDHRDGLKLRHLPVTTLSRPDSRVGSRASSLASTKRKHEEPEECEDIAMEDTEGKSKEADTLMADAAETLATEGERVGPEVTVNEPSEDGIIDESIHLEDQMDTT